MKGDRWGFDQPKAMRNVFVSVVGPSAESLASLRSMVYSEPIREANLSLFTSHFPPPLAPRK
jgi:hypothetical protein